MRLVIVGGGVAGWMAAAALAKALSRKHYDVRLVEGPDQSTGGFGPVETGRSDLNDFHKALGLDEDALLRRARGSFALGTAFTGWSRPDETYFMSLGDAGAPIGPVAFHQLAARMRAAGQRVRLADFSLGAIAAQMGRFARPDPDPRSPLSSYGYGLDLIAEDYAQLLRAQAERLGATVVGRFSHALLGDDGAISHVVLDDGTQVAGDLFLDCSGSAGLLIGQGLGVKFESWKRWLPCDRAVSAAVAAEGSPEPYQHCETIGPGWRWSVPAQGRRGETYAWSSAHGVADLGDQFIASLPSMQPTGASSFEAGRRATPWHRNCVAIGAAAAVLEPTQSTALSFVLNGVERLIDLLPNDPADAPEAAEYNRQMTGLFDRARDFLILRYKTNGRRGEAMWDECRAMEVPDELAWKMELYASRGRVPLYDEELFEQSDWVALFDGQGVRPRRYDALADGIPQPQLERHMAKLRELLLNAAASLPPHGDYLRRHGKAG